MNARIDAERILDAFLAPEADRLPDRVIGAALDEIARTPQRRALRAPWRIPKMSSPVRLAGAAIVAVLAVGLAAYAVLRAPVTVGPPPTPTAQSSPSPASSTAAAWWLTGDRNCGECLGTLQSGSHTSTSLRPSLTYTTPPGWVNSYDSADAFELLPDTAANRAALDGQGALASYVTINRNLLLGRPDCSITPALSGYTVDPIVQALASRPGLDAGTPVPVTIGGLPGSQLDISVARGWTGTCPGDDLPSVATFTNGQSSWWASQGERKRVIVLATGGAGNLVIEIAAPEAGFADHLAASTTLLQSFRFGTLP